MKYDAEKMSRLLSEMQVSLKLLQELAALTTEEFNADPHKIASSKYNLIVAIEAIIDISNHLIGKNGLRVPEDYADTFRVLAENSIISSDFAKQLIEMARFRNRLVHLYWEVDVERIYTILQENLNDFIEFQRQIKAALK